MNMFCALYEKLRYVANFLSQFNNQKNTPHKVFGLFYQWQCYSWPKHTNLLGAYAWGWKNRPKRLEILKVYLRMKCYRKPAFCTRFFILAAFTVTPSLNIISDPFSSLATAKSTTLSSAARNCFSLLWIKFSAHLGHMKYGGRAYRGASK